AAAAVGSTLSIECRIAGDELAPWVTVGSETLAEGEVSPSAIYQVSVAVDVTDGSAKECRAQLDSPTQATSDELALTFGIPPGTL
ncbi:MAG TPA: hypothetical protein PK095_25650, partial [Myxococcota bacterium]|nr:hypothetical protein [Myxococcota bacterium]